ncbi:MAG TPA: hypothetical protein VK066_17780 [Chloroflexota bacterium]|nr:hypothetical protein [Chloroflexota bacterium]
MSLWRPTARLPSPVERLVQEAALARREIRTGRFQRSMALMTAFAAVVSGFEAYTQHQRGAFAHRWMWTPVWLTPPAVGAALAALVSERAARTLLPLTALASLADGIAGFVLHLRGIQRMPGGFRLGRYNVVMGPPVFAPLLMCTVGVMGVLAGLLRREVPDLLPPPVARVRRRVHRPLAHPGHHDPLEQIELNVAHGRFQQGLALTSAVFAVLAGGEAYFEHLRGSFNQRWMWTPIWVTPPMVAAAVGAACSRRVAHRVLPVTSTVTLLDGLLGFGLHLRGIRRMPGGFTNLQFNIPMGPPLFAPLLFCSVGLLGLVAALLRRRES